jgi:hypothetical protein
LDKNIDNFSYWFTDENLLAHFKILVGHEYKPWDFLFGIDSISTVAQRAMYGFLLNKLLSLF